MTLSAAAAAQPSETFLVVGAGGIGTWDTDYLLGNADSSAHFVYIGVKPEVPFCPPLLGCDEARFVQVLAGGTVLTAGPATGFGAMYLKTIDGPVSPLISARIVNRAIPSERVELPVFRLSTLLALNPSKLAFLGATRSATTRSNLTLTGLRALDQPEQGSVSLRLEAYSADGQLLGSRDVTLQCCQPVFLFDVVSYVGVQALDRGQIRVTKTGGSLVFWGIMTSRNADGSISATLGLNP
jgi:hypothetical protein